MKSIQTIPPRQQLEFSRLSHQVLGKINSLLDNPPPEIGFSAEEIDEIIEGKNLRDHQDTIDKGAYLDDFPEAIGWWLKVSDALLTTDPWPNTQSSTDCEEDNIARILGRIWPLHPVAFVSRYKTDDFGSDPTGLELVRRYRELARYICALVQRDVPDVDIDRLLKYS